MKKRLATLIMAFVMILSLAIPAFAANTRTRVEEKEPNETMAQAQTVKLNDIIIGVNAAPY